MFQSLHERLDTLPLILAGPIVRAVDNGYASVWLALKQPARVTLTVAPRDQPEQACMSGVEETLPLGHSLHLVLARARAAEPCLRPGETYTYDLQFECDGETLSFDQALGGMDAVTYPGEKLPSFTMTPGNLEQLNLIYGSCRKPHGYGGDAMPCIDTMIARGLEGKTDRPQQLYLIGDQIYADDVADALMHMIRDLCETTLDKPEPLPGGIGTVGPGPGLRRQTCLNAGLTSQHSKSHLYRLGEYVGMYLLIWSDVLWPKQLPEFSLVFPDEAFSGMKKHLQLGKSRRRLAKGFAKEVQLLQDFRKGLRRVRRLLANISTYMMFDDHEVTDDWYLNRGWTRNVLSHELGYRVLQNGLVGYALCQGWGNTAVTQGAFDHLLQEASTWMIGGYGPLGAERISDLLGTPSADDELRELDRDPRKTCIWHYRVYGSCFEVWVLDTRTWRGYYGQDPDAIPDLIGGRGWEQLTPVPRESSELSLVIAPTNVIDIPFTAILSRIAAKLHSHDFSDYGDTWEAQTEAFERLLASMGGISRPGRQRERFVFLSGDVHYGFATRIHYWASRPYLGRAFRQEAEAVFAQLTSSPFCNQNFITEFLHRRGHFPRFPKPSSWAGWNEMPKIRITSWRGRLRAFRQRFRTRGVRHKPPLINLEKPPRELMVGHLPDWRYRTDHLRGTAVNRPEQDRNGLEIVGLNNVGMLTFAMDEDSPRVTQWLWWRVDKDAEPVCATRFDISLAFGEQAPYPKPLLPQERREGKR
ncbi:MAG: hypothetical protein QNK37_31770 [Acidobacteriota bacterium]|nr:hypothetical protein [Acidobacteriota bacterium]